MAFRSLFSSVDSSPNAKALSSLEMLIMIGDQKIGRVQSVRRNMRTNNRPVTEIGTNKTVEILPGIKNFSGSMQTVAITYGDWITRLAAITGTNIDQRSKAALLSDFPDFEISCFERGAAANGSPSLYADAGVSQNLVGGGKLVYTLFGCSIDSFESGINVGDALIMESMSFTYVDEAVEMSTIVK